MQDLAHPLPPKTFPKAQGPEIPPLDFELSNLSLITKIQSTQLLMENHHNLSSATQEIKSECQTIVQLFNSIKYVKFK